MISRMIKQAATRAMLMAVCLLFVAFQPLPAAAGNSNVPGRVTTWGQGSPQPVTVVFPSGVVPVAASAYEYAGGLAVTQDGSLYDWFGVTNALPSRVTFPSSVTTVYAASKRFAHTLALTNDGLYAWGGNSKGQLGDGTTIDRPTPVKVSFPPGVTVTAIAVGYSHSLAITNDGLYAWGDNFNGELGDGTRLNRSLPVKVLLPSNVTVVTRVAAGRNDSYALTNAGAYAWGNDFAGQLGDGSFGILPDETVDAGKELPVKVLFNQRVTSVTDIAAGEYYALAITNDGLYAWGSNWNGELGTGTGTTALPAKVRFPKAVTSVKAIAASTSHSLAITNDGLYAWGNNSQGQLGITKYNQQTPAKVRGEDNVVSVGAAEYSSIALH